MSIIIIAFVSIVIIENLLFIEFGLTGVKS